MSGSTGRATSSPVPDATSVGDAVWREPVRGGYPSPWVLSLQGRERLEAFRLGKGGAMPPLYHLTGSRLTKVGDGTADAEMPATAWLTNSAGLIGGGTLAILADIAFGCAVETRVPASTPYTTAELSLTFLRPARPGGMLTAHGQAIHVGRRVGLSEVFVLDEDETLLAHGTSRLSILPQIPDLPKPPEEWPDVEEPEYETPAPFLRPAPTQEIPQEVWGELPGLEVIRRQIAGELPPPPIHTLTGIEPTEVSEGRATAVMPASEWLNSPAVRLQGGAITMLADFAMIVAAVTKAEPGVSVVGVDLKVNFLRPVVGDGGLLTAKAEVEHAGRTLAISRARIENAEGKPVMLATSSAMFLR